LYFQLNWTDTAKATYFSLKDDASKKKQYKAVKKAINLLASNPRHPGLQTHEFSSLKGPNGEKVWIGYAEQDTPRAYRILWYYGPTRGTIIIFAITPHP
jgi:hypothetical protein